MYDAPVTKKIFDVLEFVLAQQSDVGVSAIAHAIGVSKATTFGILAGLEKEGYISKNTVTRKYSVGARLFELSRLIDRRTDLTTIAKPYMDSLSKKVNRTVFLGIKSDDKIRVEGVAEASSLFRMWVSIGTQLPLHIGAAGKMLLSLMRDEDIADYFARQPLKGEREVRGDIWREIEEIRRIGYAIDLEEEYRPGMWAAAMALHPACQSCHAAAVLWIIGFRAALNNKKLARTINGLRNTVDQIDTAVETLCEIVCHQRGQETRGAKVPLKRRKYSCAT